MRIVSTEIAINAPIEKVWKILTDVDKYPDWNPFVTRIKSAKNPPVVGTKMKFLVHFYDEKTASTKEKVTCFLSPEQNQNQSAEWGYEYSSILAKIKMINASRTQRLIAVDKNKTHYSSEEIFTGWGSKWVPYAKVKQGFVDQATALKKYSEENGN